MKALESLSDWRNWLHYGLLTVGLIIIFHFLGIHNFHTANFFPNFLALSLFAILVALDTTIHLALEVFTGWED